MLSIIISSNIIKLSILYTHVTNFNINLNDTLAYYHIYFNKLLLRKSLINYILHFIHNITLELNT